MRLHGLRFRIRSLMVTVALFAACIGVGLEYVRLKRMSRDYESRAYMYEQAARQSLRDALKFRALCEKMERSPNPNQTELTEYYLRAREYEAGFAANANLTVIYKHAASHPWEARPTIAQLVELTPEILESKPVQYFLGPGSPPPPGYVSQRQRLKEYWSKKGMRETEE